MTRGSRIRQLSGRILLTMFESLRAGFEQAIPLTKHFPPLYSTHMSNTPTPAPSTHGYVCFFKNKRTEVYASTSREAQTKAAAFFKARKQYEVTVVLAEKGGVPVVHSTASI